MKFIFELRSEEINVKKILAVINATYEVAKRKPEKIRQRSGLLTQLSYHLLPPVSQRSGFESGQA